MSLAAQAAREETRRAMADLLAPSPPKSKRKPKSDPATMQAARDLANQLGETRRDPRDAIQSIVQKYGLPFATDLYQQAVAIEQGEGLLRVDGERRTFGGVFFYLAKQALGVEAFHMVAPLASVLAKQRSLAKKKRAAEVAAQKAATVKTSEPASDTALKAESFEAPTPLSPGEKSSGVLQAPAMRW